MVEGVAVCDFRVDAMVAVFSSTSLDKHLAMEDP